MKLNLRAIEESIEEVIYSAYASEPYELTCSHPTIYASGIEFSSNYIYVAKASDLPQTPSRSKPLSLVCLGMPPATYFEKADIIVVDESKQIADVFSQVADGLKKFEHWAETLDSLVSEHRGVQSLIAASIDFFNNPLSVWTSGFRNIYSSHRLFEKQSIIEDDAVAGYDEEYMRFQNGKLIPYEDVSFFTSDPRFTSIAESGNPSIYQTDWERLHCRVLVCPIMTKKSLAAYLFIDEVNKIINEKDICAAVVLGIFLQKALVRESNCNQGTSITDEVIRDLQGQATISDETLIEAYREMGWNSNDVFRVIEIGSNEQEVHLFSKRRIEAMVVRQPHSIRPVPCESKIAYLVNENRLEDNLYKEIEASFLHQSHDVIIGKSAPFRNLRNLPFFCEQAHAALALRDRTRESQAIYSYDECMVRHLAKLCLKEIPIEALIPERVSKLMKYDEVHGTDLTGIMKTFYENEHSIARASKASCMHRNTFSSRLALAKAVMGTESETSDSELGVVMALRILDIAKQ